LQDDKLVLQALVLSRLDAAVTYPLFRLLKRNEFQHPAKMLQLLDQLEAFLHNVIEAPAAVSQGRQKFIFTDGSSNEFGQEQQRMAHLSRLKLADDVLNAHHATARLVGTRQALVAAAEAMLRVLEKRRSQEQRGESSALVPASNDQTERTHGINDAYLSRAPNAGPAARHAHALIVQNRPVSRWLATLAPEDADAVMHVARAEAPKLEQLQRQRERDDAVERVRRRDEQLQQEEERQQQRRELERQRVDEVLSDAYRVTMSEVSAPARCWCRVATAAVISDATHALYSRCCRWRTTWTRRSTRRARTESASELRCSPFTSVPGVTCRSSQPSPARQAWRCE
jgi:hypothetical protein